MTKKFFNSSLLRHPSASFPLAMSIMALTLVLGHAAIFGIVHEADEGGPAHIWQILMVAQLPILAYFLFMWLPKHPKDSLLILTLPASTWVAILAAVYWLA